MSHLAYRCYPIYESHPPKITCLEAWGKNLVVGTEKGHLLVYETEARDDPKKPYAVKIKLSLKEFSKKPIDQVAVVSAESESLFISLTDGLVFVHSLPSFERICQVAPRSLKGAHMFSLDQDKKNGIRLCVGLKKKLMIFRFENNDFQFIKEFMVPDNREYNMIDLASGFISQVGSGFATGKSDPVAIAMPDEQIMLEKDNITVTVDYYGKPTRKFGLTWSDTPKSLVQSHPFVISLQPKTVEIQFIFGSLSQMLPLAGVEYAAVASDGAVYLANKIADGTIWRLVPIPFNEQIEALDKKRRYSEALALCEILPPSQVSNREEKLANLTLLNAYSEFNAGKHGQAMTTLFKLKVDPLQVIALCAGLLPANLRQKYTFPVPIEELKWPALSGPLTALASYLEQKRKELRLSERLMQMQLAENEKASGGTANSSYGHSQTEADIGSFKQVDWNETTSLAQIIDTSLLKCYVLTRPELVAPLLKLPNHCHVKECEKVLINHSKFDELVLLYKGRGLHRNALELLQKLGQTPNSQLPGVAPSIAYMKDLGAAHIDLIVEFSLWCLQANPEAALEIFTAVRKPGDRLPSARVISHLEKFAESANAALSAAKQNPVAAPGIAVVENVAKLATAIVVRYLEFIIDELEDTTKEFHNKLAFLYFDRVRELRKNIDPKLSRVVAGTEPGELGRVRSKLLDFLEDSQYYAPTAMLSKYNFAEEGLFEERALVMSKLGHHADALREYVHNLHDFDMAEKYCRDHYDPDHESGRNVYVSLLKVFMETPTNSRPPSAAEMKTAAARLMDKYYKEIDTAMALDNLSESAPISELFPYFEKVLRELNSSHRNAKVTQNLQKSEQTRVKAELLKLRAVGVRITDDTTCPVCHKRITEGAIFARYPSGVVIHYLCFKQQPDKNVDPVTGERYEIPAISTI